MSDNFKKDSKFGGSLMDLNSCLQEESGFIAKLGNLRRTLSSIKRKKRHHHEGIISPIKQPLRAVRSNPVPLLTETDCSPASDLAARRGVFSRRHYGSVELLTSCEGEASNHSAGRFRVETGERGDEIPSPLSSPLNSPIHLENPESQTRWYFKYYLGKLHQNYVGADSEKEPFILSVVVTDANNHNVQQYRVILWRKTGAQRICLPYIVNKPQTVKGILSHFNLNKIERGPKEIFDTEIQKDLLVLEEQEGSVNFKFGVLFAKDGQMSDDEMYCNEERNEAFSKFINLLGERIKLKGWDKFKGGLDIKTNSTGLESIYTVYAGHEIMFHVSTLLPYSKDNKQQVERKRHIGNDIVNIVFIDCNPDKQPTFKPNMMKTHFTHIYAVVTYNSNNDSYRLSVFSEESVPLFGPPLPSPPVFVNHQEFRDFLLVKLINGEKAAVNNPLFAQKRERTLDMLIRNLYHEYIPEVSKNNVLYRRAISDVIADAHGTRKKEKARQFEFVRMGQTLKLKTILKGDAPTSSITTGFLRRENDPTKPQFQYSKTYFLQPWQPQKYYSDFPRQIICADSWGDKLVVATEVGLMVLEESICPRLVLDKSMAVKQISIIEQHGLLLLRADKGKDGKMYVFRLSDFEGVESEYIVKGKSDCKDNKLEGTKGCHLYSLSRPGETRLRLAVAVGKRIMLYVWKHPVAWTSWYSSIEMDPVEGFGFVREIQANDASVIITLIDGIKDDNHICVGYKNQFDIINEKTGERIRTFHVEGQMANLVTALDMYEDDEALLLLCYNHISRFQKLKEECSPDICFNWNSKPHSIVCAFPYLMAFTPDSIEIRLIINGNLVDIKTMPDLVLVASKSDIYFSSSACSGHLPQEKVKRDETSLSPPPSPSSKYAPAVHIYKIQLMCLTGQMTSDKTCGSSTAQPSTLLAPVSSDSLDKSPSPMKRSPLIHSKKSQGTGLTVEKESKDRHDSSSSDSGIMIMRLGETPPVSPFNKSSMDFDETDVN